MAEQLLNRALELNYKLDAYGKANVGLLRYAQNDCARAESFLNSQLSISTSLMLLAGCYAEDGRTEEANTLLTTAGSEFGIKTPADFPSHFQFIPGVPDRLTAQLAKVGWPE